MRRLPRTIDKPTELLGFRMDEIGVFVSVLLVFLLVDWFFLGLLLAGLVLIFLRGTRRGRRRDISSILLTEWEYPWVSSCHPGLKKLSN